MYVQFKASRNYESQDKQKELFSKFFRNVGIVCNEKIILNIFPLLLSHISCILSTIQLRINTWNAVTKKLANTTRISIADY